jgi:HEAT repeat protein
MGLFGTPNIEKMKATRDVEGLIKALDYKKGSVDWKDSSVRLAAAQALGEIGGDQALGALLPALKDSDINMRLAAVGALGEAKDERTMYPITDLLYDPDTGVRRAAVRVLGQMGDARAVGPLFACIGPRYDKAVSQAATEALIKIGAPAVMPLTTYLTIKNHMMSSADYRFMVTTAAEILGKLGDPRAVEPLVACFQDQDPEVISTVKAALVRIGKPAVEPLITALGKASWDTLHLVVEMLDQFGWQPGQDENSAVYWVVKRRWDKCIEMKTPAVGPVMEVLRESKEAGVRKAAIETLGELGSDRAFEPLLIALRNSDKGLRLTAAAALEKLGWKPGKDGDAACYWIVKQAWDQCAAVGAVAVDPLLAMLKDPDQELRKVAAQTLGRIGAPAAERLIASLNTKDEDVRKTALELLVKIGLPALEPLITAFRDKGGDTGARKAALEALVKISKPRLVEPLIATLKDKDIELRNGAVVMLGEIGDSRAVEPLISALQDSDRGVRSAAVEALFKLEDAHAVEPLIAVLKDSEIGVSTNAVWVLGALGDARAIDPLIGALKNQQLRKAAAEALSELGTPAIEPLIVVLMDSDANTRQAAARVLKAIGWQPGQDENGARYWIAQREWNQCIALGDQAVAPLIWALNDMVESGDAVNALGQIGDARAVKPLIKKLQANPLPARQSAARALVQLFQRGQLTQADKDLILSERDWMTKKHEDQHDDGDEYHGNCSIPSRVNQHTDKGLGVDFPL